MSTPRSSTGDDRRWAIYAAPPADSPLARWGTAWLGRDAETGETLAPFPLPGWTAEEITRVTAAPRHYGLHATLKPPFRLRASPSAPAAVPAPSQPLRGSPSPHGRKTESTGECWGGGRHDAQLVSGSAENRTTPSGEANALAEAVAALARSRAAPAPVLMRLAVLDRFLAIVPDGDASGLHALADACVAVLDRFRLPATEAELARRRRARLSPGEEANLVRWGYPYVFESFRFHVTLTGSLDPDTLARLQGDLEPVLAPILAAPLALRDIALFVHEDGDPFRLSRHFPFGS